MEAIGALALGSYPDVSLQQARDKANDARKMLTEYKDPSLEKKKRRAGAIENANNTFEKIASGVKTMAA